MSFSMVPVAKNYKGETLYNYPTEKDLVNTQMVHFYINTYINEEVRNRIVEFGKQLGYFIIIKDKNYAEQRNREVKPLVFISHDSRDKDSIVRELAFKLVQKNCPVWYDEFSLKVGDSLREKIEKGLKETKFCIVILSKNFLSNSGWGKTEFNSVFTREIYEKDNVILPVWHGVTSDEIYEYSPMLLDRLALNSDSDSLDKIAEKIAHVIHNEK